MDIVQTIEKPVDVDSDEIGKGIQYWGPMLNMFRS